MPSLKSLLGFNQDEEEIPFGMSWIVEILQHVIPTRTYVENFLKWGASHIIGIDSNENMIELCKSKFEGDSKLEFHVHSAIDMPYNEEFDLATSLFALQFMENFNELEKTLTNIQKALKPGGEFLAFVPHGRPDIHFTDEAGKKFGAYLKPASHPPPDGSRVKIIFYDKEEIIGDADATFFYVETYERLLRKAGFSKIEWIEPYIEPKFIAKYGEEFFQCIKDPPRDLLLYAIKG
uniref:Methyltransferase type 11 domain-containing protein n=1 Tax=Acrobeloides nanus TaxID=290746 RepID=A0A914C959_9BILA